MENFIAEIHPKVVHFPIALLATYSLLEIVGVVLNKDFISKSALLVLCIGLLTAFFAVISGNQAATEFKFWTDDSKMLLNEHQAHATYLLWLSATVCGLKIFVVIKKKFSGLIKYAFIFFAIVILYLVYKTGDYGGDLVKKFGIGTEFFMKDESN